MFLKQNDSDICITISKCLLKMIDVRNMTSVSIYMSDIPEVIKIISGICEKNFEESQKSIAERKRLYGNEAEKILFRKF